MPSPPPPAPCLPAHSQEPQHSAANRLDDAKKIEKTIGELGQMFSKMAGLVAAQAEVGAERMSVCF